jgi:hypothetical protein
MEMLQSTKRHGTPHHADRGFVTLGANGYGCRLARAAAGSGCGVDSAAGRLMCADLQKTRVPRGANFQQFMTKALPLWNFEGSIDHFILIKSAIYEKAGRSFCLQLPECPLCADRWTVVVFSLFWAPIFRA